MRSPTAAIQLPQMRTASRAHRARSDVTCPARSETIDCEATCRPCDCDEAAGRDGQFGAIGKSMQGANGCGQAEDRCQRQPQIGRHRRAGERRRRRRGPKRNGRNAERPSRYHPNRPRCRQRRQDPTSVARAA